MPVSLVQLTRSSDAAPAAAAASQAGLAQGEGARRSQLRAPEGPDARARAPHRVRRGPLSQHRRMLGAQGRHVHDPGRRLHPELHLLRRGARNADSVRSARAGATGGGGRADGAGPRGDHFGRPRRPAERRRRSVRQLHHRDQAPPARHLGRGPDPRLQGLRAGASDRDGRPARHPQSQPGDGGTPVPAGPAGRALRPRPGPAGQRAPHGRHRPDQERHHPRHG